MYIIARQGTRVPESVHVYTIKNAHIDICKYASIDKGLCSRFDVKFVTASGVCSVWRKRKPTSQTYTVAVCS